MIPTEVGTIAELLWGDEALNEDVNSPDEITRRITIAIRVWTFAEGIKNAKRFGTE